VSQDPSEMTNNNTRGVNLGDIHDGIRVHTQAVIVVAWDLGQNIISRACGGRFLQFPSHFRNGISVSIFDQTINNIPKSFKTHLPNRPIYLAHERFLEFLNDLGENRI